MTCSFRFLPLVGHPSTLPFLLLLLFFCSASPPLLNIGPPKELLQLSQVRKTLSPQKKSQTAHHATVEVDPTDGKAFNKVLLVGYAQFKPARFQQVFDHGEQEFDEVLQ